jgi:1-acyl-sn-glycerol-3-phosphate acyltransferase
MPTVCALSGKNSGFCGAGDVKRCRSRADRPAAFTDSRPQEDTVRSSILPPWFIGSLTLGLMIVVLCFWFIVMLPGVLLRAVPIYRVQRLASRFCVQMATNWVGTNARLLRLLHPVQWQIDLEGELDLSRSYLLIANHQSWADILILFDVFHRKTPFARFFMKRDLLYVPIVGQVCWAMDMPFMTRKSGAADLETMRRTCEVYREVPVTVVNFLEGTRFTPHKHASTSSPYSRLLKPKAGGIAYTLNAMGDQFAGIIDVTLVYQPTTRALAWSWLCGEQGQARLHIKVRPVPQHLLAAGGAGREQVQGWVHEVWQEKDGRLTMAS